MRAILVGDVRNPHTRRWAGMYQSGGDDVLVADFGLAADLEVEFLSLGSADLNRRRYLTAVPKLRKAVRSFRPDVVNALFASSYGVTAALASSTVPLVLGAWGSDLLWLPQRARWHRALVRWALRRSALVTFDSEDVREAIARAAPGKRSVRVVFGPESSWLEGPSASGERILSPRALDSFYRIHTILDAFAMARRNGLTWTLDVLTYGMNHTDLIVAADAAGVADAVRFHPRLNRAEVRRLFAACEVFCSVPTSDGTAASLLEGMAAGSFPVVSDLPSNREWVDDGINGLVVSSVSSKRLADALERACSDDGLRRAAAQRNREVVAATATWETAVGVMRHELESVVG